RRAALLEQLAAQRPRLATWAANCPENYRAPHLIVEAEAGRVEGRVAEAIRLYEAALAAARDVGAALHEAIAAERAARFCGDQDAVTAADAHLRQARDAYRRYGALGKARQLEQAFPQLKVAAAASEAPHGDIDLLAVMKASQAVSGEIVLAKLIESLLTIVVQYAGAERGLLVLPRRDGYRIAAEATTDGDAIAVALRDAAPTA